MDLDETLREQRTFFSSNATKDLDFRKRQLQGLRTVLRRHEQQITDALAADLGKPAFESYTAEFGFVMQELDLALKELESWAAPRSVPTPSLYQPGKSEIRPEPYGLVLIMGPWNYPLSLMAVPLISALAAGNCAMLKPSEHAPETADVLERIVRQSFDPSYVALRQGDAQVARELLAHPFDYLFFTGSPRVGKEVMRAAAEHLTPLTLELGGKSPCIVHEDAPVETSARRVAWGKFYNAGQTCVAPDYLLVHERIADTFVRELQAAIREFYGSNPQSSPDFGRIVNDQHFTRLERLLEEGEVIAGGQRDRAEKYIAPTILKAEGALLEEEIFGPLLPVLTYSSLDQAIGEVTDRPSPLTLYLFTQDNAVEEEVLSRTASGSVLVNDTLVHYANSHLPFGGVGSSGMGAYHGRAGFETFSHLRSVMRRSFLGEHSLRYPPYQEKVPGWMKKLFSLLG